MPNYMSTEKFDTFLSLLADVFLHLQGQDKAGHVTIICHDGTAFSVNGVTDTQYPLIRPNAAHEPFTLGRFVDSLPNVFKENMSSEQIKQLHNYLLKEKGISSIGFTRNNDNAAFLFGEEFILLFTEEDDIEFAGLN